MWVTKQSELVFPARGVGECFMLPCWDRKWRGKQRESHMLTRKLHSVVLHSPRRDSWDYLLSLSLSLSPPYTHTCTHGCIATHLSTHVHAQSPSCPQFGTMDFFKVSGRDNNLNCICSLKIFCFVPFSNFCWYPLSELCFRMHSMKCGNFMYVLWWWLISPWQRILTARWKTKTWKELRRKKKRVTLTCFEHDHHRDAIMCNVPFLNFQGN